MKTSRLLSAGILAAALVLPSIAIADAEAKEEKKAPEFWGKLKAGPRWAHQKAMRKGYLAHLVKRTEAKHPAFAKLLHDVMKAHNDSLGKAQGCWPNIRLALVTIAEGSARGAGKALAGPLGAALKAFSEAHVNAKAGGMDAVATALKSAIPELKGVRPAFRVAVRQAMRWLKRPCNLWAAPAKAKSEKQADPTAKPAEPAAAEKKTDVATPSTNR
ncbi:MAG: hypothetical protein HYY84_02320 [Deltaproteobacteria bacterium]|nr:hypothetical protein [Deltaproteobacteria bacterium]